MPFHLVGVQALACLRANRTQMLLRYCEGTLKRGLQQDALPTLECRHTSDIIVTSHTLLRPVLGHFYQDAIGLTVGLTRTVRNLRFDVACTPMMRSHELVE